MVRSTTKILFCTALIGVVALYGCSKKEENKPEGQAQSSPGQLAKKETSVVMPEVVKGKWKAVKIAVTDKNLNKDTVYTIPIGSAFTIPNSNLTIKVESFLPHFTMEGTTLTSLSNEPKNPATQVRISNGDQEVFKGWLFALYPTTHAFQHPVYGFSLVDFVPTN